jgi:spermidine dehydrogenase
MRPLRSDDGISRRDFINGMLVATGGAMVAGLIPREGEACVDIGKGVCDGTIGLDPRALRGGNLPTAFRVAHWLRDERLTFSQNSVRVAASSCDKVKGSFPIEADNGVYEVIVAGSGMSGLAAAFYLTRRRPGTRVLILDVNTQLGGNAGRDDVAPIPVPAATGGAYAVTPYADFLFEIYGETGIDWAANYVADPFYSYFFDDRTPFVLPGTRSWTRDVYGAGVKDMPYPDAIVQHLQQAKQDFRNWYNTHGSPTDPADNSDPKYDYLAHKTLHEYLTVQRGFHPAVSDFYTRYCVDALAGTSEQVNAYSSISFLGADYNPIFSFPGGTNGIARHILDWLIPDAIAGSTTAELVANPIRTDRLDLAGNNVRVRQGAMVVRADNGSSDASVVYHLGGRFFRASAKAVILAGQGHTAHRVALHLISDAQHEAWCDLTLVPVVIANVTLRRAAPLVDLGLGYNEYWWGSKYWGDFVIADWVNAARRFDRDRSTVLTFYGANVFPPEAMYEERVKLLQLPFSEYEQSLREDLNRMLAVAPGGFDFDRDVSAIYIYRWGHGMVFPKLGVPFGVPQFKNGQVVRTPAGRHVARAAVGRVSFGGQDTESSPAIESAIGSGLRTAMEALAWL